MSLMLVVNSKSNAYAIIMSVQVWYPLELLRTWGVVNHGCARVRINAIWIVRLHMRFPVVALVEGSAADTALK